MSDYSVPDVDMAPAESARMQVDNASTETNRRAAYRLIQFRHWATIAIMVTGGSAAIVMAHVYFVSAPLEHDLLRDFGIAVLVAALGAILYENYARSRFEHLLLTSFLGAVVSDWSRPDIWDVVKAQVIEKPVIRDHLRLGIELVSDPRLGSGKMLLKMRVRYSLNSLRTRPQAVTVRHFLDAHLQIKQHNLPRFDSIKIDDREIDLTATQAIKHGKFATQVTVPQKGARGVEVLSDRTEIAYVPGNHCFTMNEITKGVEVCLDGIPENMRVSMTIRSAELEQIKLKMHVPFKNENLVLLPGQFIEFFFQYKEEQMAA